MVISKFGSSFRVFALTEESKEDEEKLCLLLFYNMTKKCKLFPKLSHSCMFRHYRVILREFVINTLPRYTSISNAAVGNTFYN